MEAKDIIIGAVFMAGIGVGSAITTSMMGGEITKWKMTAGSFAMVIEAQSRNAEAVKQVMATDE